MEGEEGDFVWSLLGAFSQFTLPEMHLCCEADIQQRIMLRLYLFKVTENQEWMAWKARRSILWIFRGYA